MSGEFCRATASVAIVFGSASDALALQIEGTGAWSDSEDVLDSNERFN